MKTKIISLMLGAELCRRFRVSYSFAKQQRGSACFGRKQETGDKTAVLTKKKQTLM